MSDGKFVFLSLLLFVVKALDRFIYFALIATVFFFMFKLLSFIF